MTSLVSLPGFTSVTLLQEGTKAILYRAVRETDRLPVIIKGLRPEACTPNNIEQLKHEYAIAQRLNTSKTINAYALELHQGIPHLILEDFGGRSLDQLLNHVREPVQFLKIALQIVAALVQIHEHQIVHKDIKPKNIIVHPETHEVKIGDFGIAAFIPYEQQFVSSSSRIEGSLPYLSPEQTGRMNRGIDYRSDLYSLGVTFYEMLTGQLPFQGNDPLEWVHCHIARQPPSLREFNIPSVISDLVLKLLAKVAEERYQSALGLQFDLERCLQELDTKGEISPFVLGEQDVSDRLQIPEKLYGRESEMAQLLEAFERVVSQGTPELMLVSGYAGVGKSSLVNELHKPIVRSRGIFISGKFDQYKRDIPYATIVQAFQALVRQLLTEPKDSLATWKTKIQAALGNNGKLITDVIPEVEWVIGEQPAVPELGPAETQNRFNLVFQNFIGLFASKEHPLAVFLDDMQWADSATLNLIQTILTGSSLNYLCFILAYRDNEVNLTHPFSLMLNQLRQAGTVSTEIVLTPLNLNYVNQLIAETLHCSLDRSEPLARLVIHKTDGNPFFVNELLKTLYQDNLIRFNYAQHRPSSSIWQWDLAQIEALGITNNIVNLMIGRLQKLPIETQHVLKFASCIGNHFDLEILAIVAETSPEQAFEALWEAILIRFIVPTASSEGTGYRFYHDRIQQAAYALIADNQKQAIHLMIGRLLLKSIDSDQLDEQIFDVVNQLNRGLDLVTEPVEKAEILRLNLIAGQKAKASTAYRPAKNFFATATTLLPGDAWDNQYEQTFTLFLELAECLYLIGELSAAEKIFDRLLLHVQSTVDRAHVYSRQLRLYQTTGKYEEALARGIEALKMLGVSFPDPDSSAQIQTATEFEKNQVAVNLGDHQISELLNAPIIQDPAVKAIISLLTTLGPLCYMSRPHLFPLVVLKSVNYSLQFGNIEESCFAYSMYAMLLVSIFGDIPGGYAFSEMSIQLNQKLNNLKFRGTVLHIHGSHINVWCHHMATDLPFLEQGFLGCVEAGEIIVANYSGLQGSWQILTVANSVVEAYQSIQKYANFAQQCKHEAVYQTIRLQQQLLMNWRGLTYHPLALSDSEFDENYALSQLAKTNFITGIIFHKIIKLIIFFTYEEYDQALDSARQTFEFPVKTLALVIETDAIFYHALTLTALYPTMADAGKEQALAKLNLHQQQLHDWASHCAANFLHKSQLVAAEIARIEGLDLEAMRLYEQSIQSAREQGFVQFEALAYELAAKFYLAREFGAFAKTYLQEAKNAYLRWGAIAKVKHLEERYPDLLPQHFEVTNGTFLGTANQLDFLSVVKASQTISSEILLPNLLQTLMQIVLEQAGAELGYLLLDSDGTLELAAQVNLREASSNSHLTSARLSIGSQVIPQSVLNYVLRTQETVILDDATKQTLFSEDEYVIQQRPRSLLCLPILYQSELLGILYLENNRMPGAFTQEKLTALNILTGQIAISLENAHLYQTLENSQERLNLALQSGKIGVWSWDILNNRVDWDDQTYQLFGVAPGTVSVSLETVLTYLHPEDVERHNQSVERAITEGIEHNLEYRVIWQDGSIHHLAARGRAVFNESGIAVRMAGTVFDISDRVRAEAEREQAEAQRLQLIHEQSAREQAESANRIKDEFLAVLSHELRSPLNPILGWAKLLQTGKLDATKTAQALATIERNAKLQSELIEDLLDISRILRGKLSLTASPVSLATTIQAAIETVRLAADAKSITVDVNLGAQVGQVSGDATRLQQVIWNLLSNAVKFTPAGGRVEVRLEQVDGQGQIRVSDNGKGINPDFLPYVFDYFRQEDGATTRKFGGLGLGLAIVRQIVELHGGQIWVESSGEGQGATFTVQIPLASASTQLLTPKQPTASAIDLTGLHILVVDDEPDSRDFVAFVLEQTGAIVTCLSSGIEAGQKVDQFDFDVIVSDIGMPEMDGYMLMRQIRSMGHNSQIPAIALTAYAGEVDQQQALKAGFQQHLSKPVQPEELVKTIATMINRQGNGSAD